MPPYDSRLFSPPAPLALVTLRHPETGATLEGVPMLIDTGADVTLLPRARVDQLGVSVRPDESYEIMGFDGSVSRTQVVSLDMLFEQRAFKGRFLLIDQEWGLVGRDILNHLSLLFDGPGLSWRELRGPG